MLILSPMMASRGRCRGGFSLVELLIVIVIVGVLSAILFSAFSAVRRNAQRATCASNLQQLGKSLELYAQDHQGFYPPAPFYFGANGGPCVWADRVFPYVRSTAIFKCPSHKQGEFRTGCPAPESVPGFANPFLYHGSYAMNLMGRDTALNQVRLRNPSGSVLVTGNGESGFSIISPGTDSINGVSDLKRRGLNNWHGAGDNLLFADGHVKWMSLESIFQKGPNLWLPAGAS